MRFLHLLVCTSLLVAGVASVPSRRSETTADFDGARDVTFYLYTQSNLEDPELIKLDDDTTSPSFNPKNPTRFIFHGGMNSADGHISAKNAYLATGKGYNIVLVDWSSIAALDSKVASNTSILVGDYAGKVINHMIEARGLNPEALIIMGHSMGGHVAAIASNRAGGDKVVAELVALDPASELYDHQPLENQLDKTDAKYVQVIHTDGGGLGVLEAGRGDADFFPNGGSNQPGCATVGGGCNHQRVLLFYWESISSQSFIAARCSSYEEYVEGACSANEHIIMGEWSPRTASGTYYLITNPDSPYAQGENGL